MPSQSLQVDFWDVGYGDASVIWIGARRLILVDCGPNNSRLPLWVEKHGLSVDLVVLTHNDADHFDGFLNLMRRYGARVGAYAFHQDRPAQQLRRACRELIEGWQGKGWPHPIGICPHPELPQDLLEAAEVELPAQLASLRLEAIYPSILEGLDGQTKGPNYASAIIVLWFQGRARVAWPGDLPLGICADQLAKAGIRPSLLVGPHHGAPVDIANLSGDEVRRLAGAIGHRESWISVAWHRGRAHPLPGYLVPLAKAKIAVRCSQLTLRCDDDPARFGQGLFPSHDWLGLEKPPKGTSCMGAMRVLFTKRRLRVLFADQHLQARREVRHPLCVLR